MILHYDGTYPEGVVHKQFDQEFCISGNYIQWAESINLVDLLHLFSWLRAITTREYLPVSLPTVNRQARHPLSLDDTRMVMLLNDQVHAALARLKDLGLCPQRVWAIASNLPGREINLLGLIPEKKDNFPTAKDPLHLHKFCTLDFCEQATVDSTGVKLLHKCSGGCALTDVFAFTALNEGASTAWRLDGKSTLEYGQKFMAVSHVWSDGTGQSVKGTQGHRVNQCLYDFFCSIARDLGCDGIWWDAICIPDEKVARSKAIKDMHVNYENAEYTLVHDLYLCGIPWVNAEIASFAIVMSSWFTRGWTALELARSKKVLVLFKSKDGNKPVLKDLREDIFAKLGEPSTLTRQVSTTAIRAVQDSLRDLNGLLNSLGPRFTSWASDRVDIAQQLARAEVPASLSFHEQYLFVLFHLRRVYHAHLFHDAATVPGSWLPQTLLELPAVPTSTELLLVQKNGDVVGRWELLDPGSEGNLRDMRLIWNNKQPLMDLQVQRGLRSLRHHILLLEPNVKIHRRALLVRVLQFQDNGSEVPCRFVGPIYFRPTELYSSGHIIARIVNGRHDLQDLVLGEDDDAITYVWRRNPQSVTLATGSVGGPRNPS